jgi:electron transport complex protein RnfG
LGHKKEGKPKRAKHLREYFRLILVLTVISLISGGVLAQTYKFANPRIEENREKDTEKAIIEVLPGVSTFKNVTVDGQILYKGLDNRGRDVGVAFIAEAGGFQGVIRMMVGVDIESRQITGMKILEHLETPGLGARINESWFQDQFKGKSLNDKFIPGEDVDAITGATVSSRAVSDGLKNSINRLLDLINSGKLTNVDMGGDR